MFSHRPGLFGQNTLIRISTSSYRPNKSPPRHHQNTLTGLLSIPPSNHSSIPKIPHTLHILSSSPQLRTRTLKMPSLPGLHMISRNRPHTPPTSHNHTNSVFAHTHPLSLQYITKNQAARSQTPRSRLAWTPSPDQTHTPDPD